MKEKSAAAEREERILAYWKERGIFQKTLEKEALNGPFVFYEGPPTANGKPGIHHLEARAFKDAIPRYKTMQGYFVRRKGGWDTHGLPVELQVEKELGLQSKKEIESYGIAAFNKKCRESVQQYLKLWDEFTYRIGYWVDQQQPYFTYDNSYIESLWNIVSKVEEKKLLYKDYKVVPWCPRCGTALSSHELAQGYQDVKDLSVYAKFKVKGAQDTYLLAWTTTPWTLPGNVALAVGKDISYSYIQNENETHIVASELLNKLFSSENIKVLNEVSGKDLIGMEYEPLYPYLAEQIPEKEKLETAYKVYTADFVTTSDGTGIVHIAVMYGQDDFELGTKLELPKFHTVDDTGHFIFGTDFLEGKFVKDEETAVSIIKDLAHRGLLFKKEKYEHSYPHCWRCKTPLIYYARDSWYIAMSKLRPELIAENEEINWEPAHIKEGRFGEWLKEVKDWAISRERYWGTPLPIWQSSEGERLVVDSIEMLTKYAKRSGNRYLVMRHAEAKQNLTHIVSLEATAQDGLTEAGKIQAQTAAEQLKSTGVDIIVCSPFVRAQETALILQKYLGGELIIEEGLGEMMIPSYSGKTWDDYHKDYPKIVENFTAAHAGDESYLDVKKRVMEVLKKYEATYKDKTILFVTHGGPGWLLLAGAQGISTEEALRMIRNKVLYHEFDNAEIKKLAYVPLPVNEAYELDLHRPYIDALVLEKEGKEFRRVKEVMDVWFDSGAMPFAQDHYPFAQKELAYPADFISEAIDQTRGWFYTLHAVGALMGKGHAYKNVLCLGHLLDAQGKKMSKSLGNIIDPWEQMEKYGVDALRLWMFSVNQPGDSKNYDEKTVDEGVKKVFNLIYNVLSFYELYREKEVEAEVPENMSQHILDRWIMARLSQLITVSTEGLNMFKLFEPSRAIRSFIDDLSTWYLRRSRERIKQGSKDAKKTLYVVLKTLAKIMAPLTPFAAEDIWQKLKTERDEESVHLSMWPKSPDLNFSPEQVLSAMLSARNFVTMGLMRRSEEKINVRQPLKKFTIKHSGEEIPFWKEISSIIAEELNVKEVILESLGQDTSPVILDTEITPELKLEGDYRELVRAIQDLRKKQGFTPSDSILITISKKAETPLALFIDDLKKTVLARKIQFDDIDGEEINIDKDIYIIKIEK